MDESRWRLTSIHRKSFETPDERRPFAHGSGELLRVGSYIRCAAAIRDAVRELGMEVRIGVHTGEVEILPANIAGLAEGSGLEFEDRRSHTVKGFSRPVQVSRLVDLTDRTAPGPTDPDRDDR